MKPCSLSQPLVSSSSTLDLPDLNGLLILGENEAVVLVGIYVRLLHLFRLLFL